MALRFPPFAASARMVQAANNSPWMKQGETSSGVALLQGGLIDVGYAMPISTKKTGFPDGIYGSETASTVRRFQSDQGLASDGVAGRDTIGRLDQLLAGRKPKKKPKPKPTPTPKPIGPITDSHYKTGTLDPTITPDPGAGAWDSEPTEVTTWALKQAILEILPPRGMSAWLLIGDDAAMHMVHYMNNTGRDHNIDLEGMVSEVPSAKTRFENEVGQAKLFCEKLPVGTHQITSKNAESGYNTKAENKNWFFAIGGYATWGKGTVTVSQVAGSKRYRLDFEYKFYDRYNWDTGKQVEIAGITITDEFMGDFHRQGLAREYTNRGSFRRTFEWTHGAAIPTHQYTQRGGR